MCTVRTFDRAGTFADAGEVLTTFDLSKNISRLPNGAILCKDVPLGRTGMMQYTGSEIAQITPGRNGLISVHRDAEVVFHPDTISSFEGVAVTDDHPDEDVTPDNWARVAKGFVRNVRKAADGVHMIGDLVINSRSMIDKIMSGKRQVSCGYDAHYEQMEPGHARQIKITGNHLAIVPQGRCGSTCAIKDKELEMPVPEFLLRAFKAKDHAELETIAKEVPESGTTVHVHMPEAKTVDASTQATIDDLTAQLEAYKAKDAEAAAAAASKTEAEAGDLTEEDDKTEEKTPAKDAASAHADFVSRAEIIAPGISMPKPKPDTVQDAAKHRDALCQCKRRALDSATAGKDAVTALLRGRTIDSLSCDQVDETFFSASEVVKAANNAKGLTKTGDAAASKALDSKCLNETYRAFWAGQTQK